MPRLVVDPTVAAAQVVIGLRTIASRNVHCSKAPSLASPRSMAAAGKSFPKPVAAWDKPFIHSSVRDKSGARSAASPQRPAPVARKWSCATSGAIRQPSMPRPKPRLPQPLRHHSSARAMSGATCCRAWALKTSPVLSRESPQRISESATVAPRWNAAQLELRFQRRHMPLGATYLTALPNRCSRTNASRIWLDSLG
jgi:hypothetical protein